MSGLKQLSPAKMIQEPVLTVCRFLTNVWFETVISWKNNKKNVLIERIYLTNFWFETVIPWKNNKRKLFVRQYWVKYLLLCRKS